MHSVPYLRLSEKHMKSKIHCSLSNVSLNLFDEPIQTLQLTEVRLKDEPINRWEVEPLQSFDASLSPQSASGISGAITPVKERMDPVLDSCSASHQNHPHPSDLTE